MLRRLNPIILAFIILGSSACEQTPSEEVVSVISQNEPATCGVDSVIFCEVSVFRLIANSSEYDKKFVRTTGFVSRGRVLMLFPSRDFSENSITESAIELSLDSEFSGPYREGIIDRYLTVIGRFEAVSQIGGRVSYPAGYMHIERIVENRPLAWSCLYSLQTGKQADYQTQDVCPKEAMLMLEDGRRPKGVQVE